MPVTWYAAAALALVVVCTYSNAMPNAFVADDTSFAPDPENPVTVASMVQLFREDAWASARVVTGVYRPLSLLSISLEGLVHGPAATGYHVTNVAFHVLATLAVYALLHVLLREEARAHGRAESSAWPGALAGALVFGVHPIHTEAVDSIFNRSEILATLAVVGGLWFILRFGEARPRLAWSGAAVAYLAGLLCKESAAVLPLVAALFLVLVRPQPGLRGRVRTLAPLCWLLIPLGVYWILRSAALPSFAATATQSVGQGHTGGATWSERSALVATAMRDCLRMMLWPHPLRASYDDYVATGVPGAVLLLAALAGACIVLRRRVPALALGLGFFCLALLPSSRLVSHYGVVQTLAERYTYLPSVGFALLVAYAAAALARRFGLYALAAVVTVFVLAGVVLTYRRNRDWQSDMALWTAEVAAAPQNADGWKWLSAAYLNAQKISALAELCDTQLPKFPSAAPLHIHCALAYQQLRRFDDAEHALLAAVAADPHGSIAHSSLARFYASTGRPDAAEQQYQLAVDDEADAVRRHVTRGEMLVRLHRDRLDDAAAEYRAALALEPRFDAARRGLRTVQRLRGRTQ